MKMVLKVLPSLKWSIPALHKGYFIKNTAGKLLWSSEGIFDCNSDSTDWGSRAWSGTCHLWDQ